MNRFEAIKTIISNLEGPELIVHANGAISRESYACADRKENVYLLGTMGLPASVGLGIALAQPERKVIILDGDGNLLMGFGNLAMVGAIAPANFIHVVLDNGCYGTTGNQPTISSRLALEDCAKSAGYRTSTATNQKDALLEAFQKAQQEPGPHFIRALVSPEVTRTSGRIPYSAQQIKERFLQAL